MKNKIIVIFLVAMFFLTTHSSIATNLRSQITNNYLSQSDEVHIFYDSIGDVFDDDFDPHPEIKDIDIDYIVYTKTGKKLNLDIFMVDKLVKSTDIELAILVSIYTSEQVYQIQYIYSQLFENITCSTLEHEYIYVEITGFNTKQITISFDLINETEIYQDIFISTAKADVAQTYAYTDIYPNEEFLNVDISIEGEFKVGKTLSFSSFVSNGTPPYTYEWVFGDNDSSTEQNPIHIYDCPGEYRVVLYVVDSEGIEGIDFESFTIKKKPRTHLLFPLTVLSFFSIDINLIYTKLIYIKSIFQ